MKSNKEMMIEDKKKKKNEENEDGYKLSHFTHVSSINNENFPEEKRSFYR